MDLEPQELPLQERLPAILRLHTSLLTQGSGSLSPRKRPFQSPSATLRCETFHFFHFAEEETGLSRLDKLCLIPAGLERDQLLRQDTHTHGRRNGHSISSLEKAERCQGQVPARNV